MSKTNPSTNLQKRTAKWIIISLSLPVAVLLLHLAVSNIFNGTDVYVSVLYCLVGVIVIGIIIELICTYKLVGFKKLVPILPILVLTAEATTVLLYAAFIVGF